MRTRGLLIALIVVAVLGLLVLANFEALWNGLVYTVDLIFNPAVVIDPNSIVVCSADAACSATWSVVIGLVMFLLALGGFAYVTLMERRVLAFLQHRIGPNRAGPLGLLQPIADAIKLIFKEDIVPGNVLMPVYYIAPALKAVPVILLFVVLPIGNTILIPWFNGLWYEVPLYIVDVNVAVLWVLAFTSLATYGIVLAGWSSNNKYSMLGGLRSSAQMISYELSFGLTVAVPVMIVGSLSFQDIVRAQATIPEWIVFQNPVAAALLIIVLFAETSRAPFDLPEAEQELTQGYTTEYSGMRFALFMMAEYVGMIAVSAIIVLLFFGGYNLFPIDSLPILAPVSMILKVIAFLFFFIWVRATMPRIRYDRLMAFGWKVMLPLSLVAVAWTAIAIVIGEELQSTTAYAVASAVFFVVIVGAGVWALRGMSGREAAETSLGADTRVTGEDRGLGWSIMMLVGFVLGAIFAIVGWFASVFRGLGRLAQGRDTSVVPAEPAAKSGD